NTVQKDAEGALITGLKRVGGQLSTDYSAEGSPGQNSADQEDFGNEMTLNGTYTWGQKEVGTVPALGRKGYSRNPVLPSYLLEEPYDEEGPDGNKVNPNAIQPVRRYQWWGWLSTIGGYISGNGYVWPFNAPQWQQHLDTKGTKDMERLNNFIKSITWWKLVPSGLSGMKTLITAGGSTPSNSDYVSAAATPEGALLVAYIPPAHKGGVTVDMTAISGSIHASWLDPTSGSFTKIAGSPFANTGNHQFIPPPKNHEGSADWVLLMETPDARNTRTSLLQPPINGPLRQSGNPNYFEDASGKALILSGSQTWNTFQDWGSNASIQKLDFNFFANFLKEHGHNFTLLWSTELPKFAGFPTTESSPPEITVSPFPWLRTGPGLATDGGLKFDLTKPDQNYFDLLRARVKTLDSVGVYAGVYLFSAEWLLRFRCPTDGYPFSGGNNVNGVDDGYTDGPPETWVNAVTMRSPNTITRFQDDFVKKTINTLNDLPNVLWIVSQESPENATWWNDHLISLVGSYEKGKRYQHPIGYGVPSVFNPQTDSALNNSDADWVAPFARVSPARSCGTGKPKCKVNINDSDHSYWEIWNDTPEKHRNYVWKNFANGNQVLFMDPYLVYYPRQQRNLCISPVNAIGSAPDRRWEDIRNNMGYTLKYSRRLSLVKMAADSNLCSTRFCLAQTPAAGAEYLVYAPTGGSFTMNLSAMPNSRKLAVEWFNPSTGETIIQNPVNAGSASHNFITPFKGDAVLYLVDTKGHK
ncbi:MAG: putative collagen-binding domain-containing protein, partial [Ginsengibacter sp.]